MPYTIFRIAAIGFVLQLLTLTNYAQSGNSSLLDFENAKRILRAGEYPEALEIFNRLVSTGFDDSTLFKFRGISRYHLQDYTGAIEDLDRLRSESATEPEVLGLLGICKYKIHEWQAAKYFLEQARTAGYRNSKASLYLGYLYLEAHQYAEALAELNSAAEAGEKKSKLYESRGIAAFYSGQIDLAISDLEKTYPERKTLQICEVLGLSYASKNQYQESLHYLLEADSMKSKYGRVYFEMGNGLLEMQSLDKAIESYTTAITLHYSEVNVYESRGNVYLALGKFDLAINDFQEVINRKPDNATGYLLRANAYFHKNDWAKVITDLSLANALGGQLDANAWAWLIVAKMNLKNPEGALVDVNSARKLGFSRYEIDGKINSFSSLEGVCLVSLKRYDDAIMVFNQAEKSEGNMLDLHLQRARAFVGLGRYEEAIADLEKAQKLDPTNPHVFYNSAVIKEQIENYGAAVLDYNRAIQLAPGDAAAYYGRAYSKSMKGEAGGAIADLDKAISLNGADAAFYKLRANLYYQMKNKDKACFDWRKAVEFGDEKARFSIEKYCNSK